MCMPVVLQGNGRFLHGGSTVPLIEGEKPKEVENGFLNVMRYPTVSPNENANFLEDIYLFIAKMKGENTRVPSHCH